MGSGLYHVVPAEQAGKEAWNDLASKSRQYTTFMRDDYLDAAGYDSRKYIVYRKNSVYAGICIPVSRKTGLASGMVPYAPYQGLLYAESRDAYKDYRNNLEAAEALLDYLYESTDMKRIAFGNSFEVKDMRAVQWHHYRQPQLGMYDIQIRYTVVSRITSDNPEEFLSRGRKLDYKNSREKYGLACEKSEDARDFFSLYEKTFSRQDIALSDDDMDKVRRIVRLLMDTHNGELYYAVDQDGKRLNATFIVYERNYAYYLFGANDPAYRNHGGGTLLLVQQMRRMKERGIEYFDFIGANSPQRGDFKLSFGGELRPYYICEVQYV